MTKKITRKTTKVWYAKGGDIARCGPFKTDVEAAAAMELVGGGKPDNFAIWPEMKLSKI